jgi:pimeloyl-ACP methyl ester carboxylesterase
MRLAGTFYTDDGSGKPVLLIHGWACDGSDWSWLSAALVREYRVVVPDLRGHGRSAVVDSHGAEGYRPEDFATDIVALITALELTDVVLVGHSLGGIVASLVAVSHPQLVAGVVLIDPSYGETVESMAKMLAAVKVIPHKIARAAFASFYSDATPPWLPIWHARRILGTPAEVVRETMLGMFAGDGAGDTVGEGVGIRSTGEPIWRLRTAPVLAIYAGNHTAEAEWERSLNPASEVEIWLDHGHFLHHEDPERFADRTIEWLRLLRSHPRTTLS